MRQVFCRGVPQIWAVRNSKSWLSQRKCRFIPVIKKNARCGNCGFKIGSEESDVIQRWRKRNDSFARDAIISGLESNNAAKRSGTNKRANGLSSQCKLTESRCDCRGRSAT